MSSWLSIELNHLDNAAFAGEDLGLELARILRTLAQKCENMTRAEFVNDDIDGALRDINGNKVGRVSGNFEDDEDNEQEIYDEVRKRTKWMSRGQIEEFVIDYCCVAVNDTDTERALVDVIVEAIKAGDTKLEALEDFADNQP